MSVLLRVYGFRGLGFRVFGKRGVGGFRVFGFWGLGDLGFTV